MKNKQKLIVPLVSAAIIILFLVTFLVLSNSTGKKLAYQTKTSNGIVTIDITPKEYKDNKLYMDISINTHTVDLAQYDLKKLTTLYYLDKTIKLEQAPELKEHHSSGILIFNTEKEIKNFKVVITGIPDISERVFEW